MDDNRESDIMLKENCRVAADMVVDALMMAGIVKDKDGDLLPKVESRGSRVLRVA